MDTYYTIELDPKYYEFPEAEELMGYFYTTDDKETVVKNMGASFEGFVRIQETTRLNYDFK